MPYLLVKDDPYKNLEEIWISVVSFQVAPKIYDKDGVVFADLSLVNTEGVIPPYGKLEGHVKAIVFIRPKEFEEKVEHEFSN